MGYPSSSPFFDRTESIQLTRASRRPIVKKAPGGSTMITPLGPGRRHHLKAGEHPGTQYLANRSDAGQCQTESNGLTRGIRRCGRNRLPGGTNFTAADDDAVYNNQRDIGSQGFAHLIQIGRQQAIDNGDKCGNGQGEDHNPQMGFEQVANEADDNVGTQKHRSHSNRHGQGGFQAAGNRQGRA